MGTTELLRQKSTEYAVKEAMRILGDKPEKQLTRLVDLADRIATAEDHKQVIANVRKYVEPGDDGELPAPVRTALRGLRQTAPDCRARLFTNALVNGTWRGRTKRDAALRDQGFRPPSIMLMSPTMRCNLHCTGCYAADYTKNDDLSYEVMDRVLSEANDLGISNIILLGGEPFVRSDVLDLAARHDDMAFMAFSNGTLLTEPLAHRLAELGNISISVSVDGLKEAHDSRRGDGVFDRAIEGLRHLRAAGVPFGFSSMITSANCEDMIADEFIDMLVDEGCLWGWHFLYMPVGEDADLSLMPTPEQREHLRQRGAQWIRMNKEVFVIDFWNDAPYVGGCIAGGRQYFHVNANGDVEPCIFAHFATDNIKHVPLAQALNSPLFQAIRSRQPYSDNLLRPCMIIDNTDVLRDVVASHGAYPTHPQARRLLDEFAPALDDYAESYRRIADTAWEDVGRGSSQAPPCVAEKTCTPNARQ